MLEPKGYGHVLRADGFEDLTSLGYTATETSQSTARLLQGEA